MMRALRLLARMATASLGGYWAQGLHAIADTACKACISICSAHGIPCVSVQQVLLWVTCFVQQHVPWALHGDRQHQQTQLHQM